MEYRRLGRAGLRVSALTLGTFTFGGRGPFAMVGTQGPAEARALVDVAIEGGITLFDTANMYSMGLSEQILGEVLEGRRDDVLISSKARMRIGDGPNDAGMSRWHLIRECERSLTRLRTDRIDLYHIHEWDGATPLDEMLEALHALREQGKIRYIGCSNFSGWHVMKALALSEARGLARFVTQQIHYTLEAREAEYELLPISVDQGLGVTVWSPLAAGLLSGKHRRGAGPAEGSRQLAGWTEPPIRDEDRLWRIVESLSALAGARGDGTTPSQLALAWLLERPAVSSLVIGARHPDQLRENLRATDIALTEEERTALGDASAIPLIYPYWHQQQFAAETFTEADRALHDNLRLPPGPP
ncbi:MAG: aldo/keto reductase [Pseudomonadota bacterium]